MIKSRFLKTASLKTINISVVTFSHFSYRSTIMDIKNNRPEKLNSLKVENLYRSYRCVVLPLNKFLNSFFVLEEPQSST